MLQCGIPTKKRKLPKYQRHNGGERPTKHDSAATTEESKTAVTVMLASLELYNPLFFIKGVQKVGGCNNVSCLIVAFSEIRSSYSDCN